MGMLPVGSSSPDPGDNLSHSHEAALPEGGFAWGALENTPRSALILKHDGCGAKWQLGGSFIEIDSVELLGADVELTACFLGLPSMEEGYSLTANMEKLSQFKSELQRQSLYLMLQAP